MTTVTCVACGGTDLEPLFDLGWSPTTTGALYDSPERARTVTCGRIDLVACRNCGHVCNQAFDATLVDYDGSYDNSLHFSDAFQKFGSDVANRLVASYDLAGKHMVEIGSGHGDFLVSVTDLARATGTGYDPTYTPHREYPGITFITDYFRPAHNIEPYDLLICRHVLEHIAEPGDMLRGLRTTAPPHSVLYLEVPAAEFCFGPSGMWDCIYPHVSYFSSTSLRHLVERCGFEILAEGTGFDHQFLWIEARPAGTGASEPSTQAVAEHLHVLRGFMERWNRTVTRWRADIDRAGDGGLAAPALWGAGAKAVTFLNAVDPRAVIPVVDLNPRKWGRYLPGTAHMVQPPQSLAGEPVSTVLITNPVYRNEIAGHLEQIGVSATVVTV